MHPRPLNRRTFWVPKKKIITPPSGSFVTGGLTGRYTAIDKTLGNLQTWVESTASLGTWGDTGSPYPQVTAASLNGHNGLIFSEGDTAYSAPANMLALPSGNSTCMMIATITGSVGNTLTDTETLIGIGATNSQYEITYNKDGANTLSFSSSANTSTLANRITTPTFTITTPHIITCIHNGTTLSVQIGDGSVTTIASNLKGVNATATKGNCGYSWDFGSNGFGGTIYEMLFYNTALNSTDQATNRAYFVSTWGVSGT